MKRTALYICIVIFGASGALAGGYQAASWGMSPEETAAAFPDAKWYYKKAKYGSSMFSGKLLEMKVVKEFHFTEERKLFKVTITPLEGFGSRKKYIDAAPKLRQAMRDKYGPPTACFQGKVNEHNEVDCIKPGEMPRDLVNAILSGAAEYREYWDVPGTVIALQLRMRKITGGTLIYDTMLMYMDVDYKAPKPDVSSDIQDEL